MAAKEKLVCVTGAGGFVASWLVKLLLESGYHVRGTVRDPGDKLKNGHLKELEGAQGRLSLIKADLMDYDALRTAIHGCSGVFHTASPILLPSQLKDPQRDLVDPIINGTLNVLNASHEAKVKRVVVTSSSIAAEFDPKRGEDVVVDESCWSDIQFCHQNQLWYMGAKIQSELDAWKFAKEHQMDMVTILPAWVLGPILQPTLNATNHMMKAFLDGSSDVYPDLCFGFVHVKDTAKAHILAYENPSASGRYLCVQSVAHTKDVIGLLQNMFPMYNYPKKCAGDVDPGSEKLPWKFSNSKLHGLGLEFTPLNQMLRDFVESLRQKGLIK